MTAGWAVLMGITLSLVGCGGEPSSAPPTTTPSRPPGMEIDCADVPEDACIFVAAGYGNSIDQVTAMTMRCVVQTCSLASGKTEIGLLYATGQRMSHGTEWGAIRSDTVLPPVPLVPAPRPGPLCFGVVQPRCIEMAQEGDVPIGAPDVTTITVRCVNGGCGDQVGEGETVIRFEDGTRSTVAWAYGG